MCCGNRAVAHKHGALRALPQLADSAGQTLRRRARGEGRDSSQDKNAVDAP